MAALPPSSSSSRSLRSSKRARGPLQELPLDQFLAPLSISSSSKLGTSTKRPVSPGTPVLYSPAKRRILNEEGLCAEKSPLSPRSPSAAPSSSKQPVKAPQHYYQQHQQSTARFVDALMGPHSPARKLDFGTPKNVVGGKTPLRQSAEDRLGSSPEIKAGPRSRLRSRETDGDYFSISSQSRSQPPQSELQSQSQTALSSSSSQSHRHLEFFSTPRELHPPIDPQSEHYPGFTVYQDPHILIPTLRLASAPSTPSSALAPYDYNLDGDSEVELIDSRELVKENLAPRRKTRKAATAPTPEKANLFSPPTAKSSSVPATPPREYSWKEREILTPRRLSIFGVGVGSGLGKPQQMPSKEDRRSMRRILEEEVDGE